MCMLYIYTPGTFVQVNTGIVRRDSTTQGTKAVSASSILFMFVYL